VYERQMSGLDRSPAMEWHRSKSSPQTRTTTTATVNSGASTRTLRTLFMGAANHRPARRRSASKVTTIIKIVLCRRRNVAEHFPCRGIVFRRFGSLRHQSAIEGSGPIPNPRILHRRSIQGQAEVGEVGIPRFVLGLASCKLDWRLG